MAKAAAVCVFCGSHFGADSVYREAAARLGRHLAESGTRLVYGGGGIGLMGALAVATHDAGGHVCGILPRALARQELQYADADRKIVTETMHQRKQKMFDLSDAFVVLPGGIGTLEETVEILSWAYLDFHRKPVVLVNIAGYWDSFLALVRHMIERDFARPDLLESGSQRGLMHVVESVDEVLPLLNRLLKERGETAETVSSSAY